LLVSEPRPGERLLDLVAVMARLRAECAWTQGQTHDSLGRYLLEETYETLEALDAGDPDLLREELGDLLMQVVFHAAVAADTGEGWDVDDVAAGITDKLVRRNPHVFGDGTARTPEEIDAAWQAVKAREKPRASPLDGIARDLPALATARKVLDRVPDLDTSGDDVGSRLLRLVAEAREQGIDAEEALRRAVRDRLPGPSAG
jgi:XTP/dITP diphosphohydrolase